MTSYSTALGATKLQNENDIDNYPTPLYATRIGVEKCLKAQLPNKSFEKVYEPSCGAGHMCRALSEYYDEVVPSDLYDYGYKGTQICDYLKNDITESGDIFMNPPFSIAKEFILKARRDISNMEKPGALMVFIRLQFLESKGRYKNLFNVDPPSHVFPFVERVGLQRGCLDENAGSATAYMWMGWLHGNGKANRTELHWIEPCREKFDKPGDWKEENSSEMQSIEKNNGDLNEFF